MSPLLRASLLVCLACILAADSSSATAQQATFRDNVDLVQLDVIVLDKNRRPVTGLTAADFTIEEDGSPKTIEAFVPVTLPGQVTAAGVEWTRTVPPDVVTNQLAEDGRLVVILMDRSIRVGAATTVARSIARAAIDGLGASDLAAVIHVSPFGGDGTQQNLSSDRDRLRKAIDAPFMGLTDPPVFENTDDTPSGACLCGLCSLEAIERVANAMAAESRRQKVLLFIGSQIAIDDRSLEIRRFDFCRGRADDPREKALRAVDRANVTLHTIDPNGLETLAAEADPMAKPLSPAGNLQRQADLTVFPDYTGGRAVFNTNAPESVVPAIFAESQSYYLLGFQRTPSGPRNERLDIRVRVNRDDVTVQTRRGYYPPSPASPQTTTAPSEAAAAGLLPRSDVPLSLGLVPRFRSDGTGHVSAIVSIAASALAPPRPATTSSSQAFDVVLALFDPEGRSRGTSRQSMEIPRSTPAGSDYEWQVQLPVEPGSYEVRVGLSDSGSGKAGSVYGYVDVPAPGDDPLSLSGVILTAAPAAPSSGRVAAGVVSVSPTLRRTFGANDDVTAFVQARQKPGRIEPVVVRTRIVDARGQAVVDGARTLAPPSFGAGGVAEVQFSVPVSGLKPGRHLLSIEATLGSSVQRRDVPFEVR